jgi:small ubiquitin-related modifier
MEQKEEIDNTTKDNDSEHIKLKVLAQDNTEIHFKIRRTTPFKKLMEAYCQKQGIALTDVRFVVDGMRILPGQTPKELSLEDGDAIDVLSEQMGGFAVALENL